MWPLAHPEWCGINTFEQVFRRLRNEMNNYPVLAAASFWLHPRLWYACERTFDRVEEHCCYPGFFGSYLACRHWLRVTAVCEARRELLDVPAVAACLATIPVPMQQVLYWSYVDAFSPLMIGQVLNANAANCLQVGTDRLAAAHSLLEQAIVAANANWYDPNGTFPR